MAVGREEVLPDPTIQTSIKFRDFSFQQSSSSSNLAIYFTTLKSWRGLLRDGDLTETQGVNK